MDTPQQWIWLPEEQYPNRQTTRYSERVSERRETNYTVALFSKSCRFPKAIDKVTLQFSADTAVALFCNGRVLAYGPPLPGGDFLADYHNVPLNLHYAYEMVLTPPEHHGLMEGHLDFSAQVRMGPVRCFDFSQGHGGFFLTARVLFTDGTDALIHTDHSWTVQLLSSYIAPGRFDNRIPSEPKVLATSVSDIWNCQIAPIPPCTLESLEQREGGTLVISAGTKVRKVLTFDRIYAGYLKAEAKTSGTLKVSIRCRELEEQGSQEEYIFGKTGTYIGLELHSAGNLLVEAENHSDQDAVLNLTLITSHYPVTQCAKTVTSDPELNLVLDTCIHTLKYCRQSIHLDSPRHCELLACTGDYYIESLMTAMSFADMELAAFDIRRTAHLLRTRDGRMFHTTYSLIWVQMLMDTYRFTGELALLSDCSDALTILLNRFHTYLGDNGLVENPPDYMFIDWLVPDGISMHHPPKALGQTCLNLYYYGALKTAETIYDTLGETAMLEQCREQRTDLHRAVETHLYDAEQGLFFEGLNTPTDESLLYEYMPQNVSKRYYRMHANILAAYFGFFDRDNCADLLTRILQRNNLGKVQPFFCHFLLEAVYRCGLREQFTLAILEQWKAPVRECSKGLAEGFHKPEETYVFDHSHAWGGTPAWSLPLALSGLEILEPGFRKIRLSPSLLGLRYAHVEIPTPFGMIQLDMEDGTSPRITLPDGIILS